MEALNKKLEKFLKQKERDIENLQNLLMKFCKKMDESGKTFPTIEEIDCVGEKEETNLDLTFVNPSSKINCEMCDFVAKNVQGLKFHKKAKHTKNKFNCDL